MFVHMSEQSMSQERAREATMAEEGGTMYNSEARSPAFGN